MYFKRLELFGFKSFTEKTVLDFEPGITAVVGPNGCGKSNIFDSIRWVLGEQSVKSLRGSKMEDVIFNGTDTKPALGFAEVALTFSNESKALPMDYEEITVMRRLFRSGESEYFINKNLVRLKDILELFMGTGIGAESYSLVEQGKIDLILSSRPEDRRLIFDEAAGVTKYKTQKKEALRRLEDTENNLLRINDIVAEVKRQIGSLERQAAKARRYKEVFDKLQDLDTKLASFQLNSFNIQNQHIKDNTKNLESQIANLTSELENTHKSLAEKQTELTSLNQQIASSKGEIISIDNSIVIHSQRITINQENIKELQDRIIDLQKQKEQLKERLDANKDKLSNLTEEIENLKNQENEKKTLITQKESLLEEINKTIKECQNAIVLAKRKILELAEKQVAARNNLNEFTTHNQTTLARNRRLVIEKEKINQEQIAINEKLDEITAQLESSLEKLHNLENQIKSSKEELTNKQDALAKLKEQVDSLEKEKFSLESQKEFLNTLKLRYEEIPQNINGAFFVEKLPDSKVSGIIARIKKIENITNPELRSLAGNANFRIECEAKSMPLDASELDEKIKQIDTQIVQLKQNHLTQTDAIENIGRDIGFLDTQLHDIEIMAANQKTQKESFQTEHNKVMQELSVVEEELNDTTNQLTQLKTKEAQLNDELSKIDQQTKENNESINTNQEMITQKAISKEEVVVSLTKLRTELSSLDENIASKSNTLKLMEEAFKQDNESFQWHANQMEESNARTNELKIQIKDLEEQIKQKESSLKTMRESLIKLEERHSKIGDEITKYESDITTINTGMEELKAKTHKLQMEEQQLQFQKQNIKDRILQIYKVAIEKLAVPEENIDSALYLEQINQLKEKLDSYGTVNLVAIEEYEELKKRYEFLIQQQDDLTTAKESLHQAIQKINRTTKQLFTETFQKVAEEFKNYFRMLFGGGDAQLFLVDEQDPLESGIEIICRPPGKKLQNVLLLSGGEKAMSAIALMFAVFKVKPSPFCILDEIDASLDEANVERFSRILQDFAQISQFITITHNKKTIAKANVMYGITMEESGVSKIVSVKFAEKKSNSEAIASRNEMNQTMQSPLAEVNKKPNKEIGGVQKQETTNLPINSKESFDSKPIQEIEDTPSEEVGSTKS